jgi:V/A-type H+-transporting ATPase subunit I
MMADMGYGLIMVAAALVAMKKIKPREGTLSFCQILLYCGISTFIMGALTGGFFGDLPYQLVHMFNPASTWQGLPYLFNPLAEGGAEPVLYGAMVLGVIQLNTGMVINFIKKKRRGELASAIFEEGSLWIILLGGILYALPALGIVNIPTKIGLVVLIVGAVCLLFGAGREAKGFGKVTAAIGCIYNTLTGWFGDILSYARLMALMLAGSVIAQVFNTLGAMPGSILVFIPICLLGNALNFGLNLLGCYVHDLRLQCLEFFNKFYVAGGKPFEPLAIRSKYYTVIK